MRLLMAVIAVLLSAMPAMAADLRVSVTTPSGKAIRDAVVMVYPKAGASKRPIRFSWPYVMVQKNMQFDPFVLIVPVGADVAFPNRDNTRHHVYSFSPPRPFQLKLYGHDETRVVTFDKAGVVAIGCNIHDNMTAFIRVVDTPWAAKTGADGQVVIRDTPAGAVTVAVWHPYLKGGGDLTRQLASGAGAVKVAAELRAPPTRRHGY